MFKKLRNSRMGFIYLKNRNYWLSRVLPAGFGTPAYALVTFLPMTIVTATNNGEPFPVDRLMMGVGFWFLGGIAMSAMLYGIFRILDKKDYNKLVKELGVPETAET